MNRRWMALLLAGLLLAGGALTGCQLEEERKVVSTAPEDQPVENDGEEALLVVGLAEPDATVQELVEEIGEKYEADYPNTQVEVRSYGSWEALEEATASGEVDIPQLREENVPGAVMDGLLLDLYQAVDTWKDRYSLSQEAWQAARSMGKDYVYVLPYDFDQFVTYYRTDWFEEYNATAESAITPREWCRSWDQIQRGHDRMGDKCRVLFGGADKLGYLFDSNLWSDVARGRMADAAAAYFAAGDEHVTICTWDMAEQSVKNFRDRINSLAVPETLEWTEEEAVEAFVQGEGAILFASSQAEETLREQMPEGSWAVIGPVQGGSGAAVICDQYVGWGVSAASEEPETAAHFLLFLSNPDNNTHFAKEAGCLPIHVSALEMDDCFLEGDRAGEAYMMEKADWYEYADPPVMYEAYEPWTQRRDQLVRQLLSGEVSPAELLAEMDQYWTQALEDEGDLIGFTKEEEE